MRRVVVVLSAALLAAAYVGTGATDAHGVGASPSAASQLAKLATHIWPQHAGTAHAASAPTMTTASVSNSVSQQDPTGDVQPSQDNRADITAFGVTYGPSSITTFVDVAQGTDPTTDPNWAGDTGAFWGFDTNADGNPEFILILGRNPDNGQPLGGVLDTGQNPTVHCLAMVTWDGHNRYRASFDPGCIGSPASVRVAALFSYDTAPSDTSNTPFNDVAPDSSSADPPVFAGPIVDPGPNGWGAFEFLGTPLSGLFDGAPDVASWDAGRLDGFIRGSDNQLWHVWFDGAWHGEPRGGQLFAGAGPAVAAWAPNRLDVFVTGTDRQLYHTWWDGTQWGGFEPLGGVLKGGPDVAAWSEGRLDVFARGADDQLWHKWWDGTRWSGFEPLGGTLTSDPTAASWSEGRLDVFVRGADDQMYHKFFDGGWSGWEPLGGALASDPGVTAQAPGVLDVLALSGDSALWHDFYP